MKDGIPLYDEADARVPDNKGILHGIGICFLWCFKAMWWIIKTCAWVLLLVVFILQALCKGNTRRRF